MNKKLIHTMLRVGNLDTSIDFYTRVLGMEILRTFDNEAEQYSLAFLGYGPEEKGHVIELTYNYGVGGYSKGDVFGHVAIGVEDCSVMCDLIRKGGGRVVRNAGLLQGGDEIIAFCEDPDGNRIELIEKDMSWFQ